MLSKELEFTLNMAFREARDKRHEFMTVEHLLLALLDNPAANKVLRACGAEIDKLKEELVAYIEESTPMLPLKDDRETQPTLGFQRVLQRAVFHVQSSGKKEVTGANVLVAIFGERESQAVYFLNKQNITRLDIVNYMSHGISKVHDSEDADAFSTSTEEEQDGGAADQVAARILYRQPQRAGAARQDRPADRPATGDPAHPADPLSPTQEQSPLRGRGRRRQNCDRRGARQDDRRRRRAGGAGGEHYLCARPRRAARGHQVPGRFREATEGRAPTARQGVGRNPIHRRDSYHHRCRRRLRRGDGRIQSDQADAGIRRSALHRLHHLPRVPRHLREGPCPVAPIPEDRHHRTVG